MSDAASKSKVQRIELRWIGQGDAVRLNGGDWEQVPDTELVDIKRPLHVSEKIEGLGSKSIFALGERPSTIKSLRQMVGRTVSLIYADLPRVEGYDETRAFQTSSDFTWSTWLSVIDEHLRQAKALLASQGVMVVQVGDSELPYARLLLDDIFGRSCYLGTIVWQSHYSPKGGKPTSEIAAIHENLLVYCADAAGCPNFALLETPEDYANTDNDPRGPWIAKQKDAGRDTVKLSYQLPPYRWRLSSGTLPPGLWRLNPISGVIYGTPAAPGNHRLCIEVSDSSGATAEGIVDIVINLGEAPTNYDGSIWWIDSPAVGAPATPLALTTSSPLIGCVGQQAA